MESAGSPSRETYILVIVLETSEVYIIASLSTRCDTQVIRIDLTTGSLSYNGNLGHDLFNSEEEALNYITGGSRLLCKSTTHARALLGYAALGSFGLLLLATKLTCTIPMLPGGGRVFTVTESKWIKVQLQNPQPQGKGELKNIQELSELDIDGKHYFCETRDITRPFPSAISSQSPDDEFVWNAWFSKPFRDIGLPKHCIILLQGFAECRNFTCSGQGNMVALVARRSRLHPGTRYLARGLNACSSTGNEVECEQLVWLAKKSEESFPFSSYVWRRGTIPIWWGADLKFTSAEAEIYVYGQEPYRGSALYYQRLSKRYKAQRSDLTAVREKKTPLIPIICVNLLRNQEGKSETILVEQFKESIKYIKSTGKLPYTWIQLINYDWHATVKLKGEQQTIEGLWKLLKAPTISIGFSEGKYYSSKQQMKECSGLAVSNCDFNGGFCLTSLQNGVIRFNCADSLDRTNAASFFGSLQVFVEQCKRLGISLDRETLFGFTPQNKSVDGKYGLTSLPPGWEERRDAVTGKSFYIDHNTRTTTWEHPCQDMPWKRFDMSFDQFKSSSLLAPVNQLADLFLLAGDIHATLYTGSKAMHSQILNVFTEDGGKFSKFSAAQNVKITLQRRYQNVLVDSSRQKQLEMFLGIRLFKHLSSVPVHPLKVLSRPSGCFLKPIPSMKPVESDGSCLLTFQQKDLIWVCPPAADVVELFIYLSEPCHVCQLLLTVSHDGDDSSYPATVDVRTGYSLDGIKLVLEGACIPQCSSGTNLLIPLTGRINPEDLAVTGNNARLHAQEYSYLPMLYDFEELEGELNFLTRVVALTFYPSVPGRTPLTLGEIEVLGVSLPWRNIFNQRKFVSKFVKNVKESEGYNSFIMSRDEAFSNPFYDSEPKNNITSASSNGEFSKLSQPCITSHAVDLLTGDLVLLHSASLPELSSTNEQQAMPHKGGILDFFDDPTPGQRSATSAAIDSDSYNKKHGDTKIYVNVLKTFTSNKGKGFDFMQAVMLEITRLRLCISAAERDRALLAISIDPAKIDPNRLVDELYMAKLCNYADRLAVLGQAAFEDKIIASIGIEIEEHNEIDFWNIGEVGDTCIGNKCEVQMEIQSYANSNSVISNKNSPLLFICSECERKACKFCSAGLGASLLTSSNYKDLKIYSTSQSGSSHGLQSGWASTSSSRGGTICKSCCDEVILAALHVDYLRVLGSLRRRTLANNAAVKAVSHALGPNVSKMPNLCQDEECSLRQLRKLLNGEESLAEFPYANLLYTVETAVGSLPPLSLLAPLGVGDQRTYWRASPSSSIIRFSIVLGRLSDVSGAIFVVSSCGYSASDCPTVQIWVSNTIHEDERSYMGKWDVHSLISSSPHLYGSEKSQNDSDIPRHIKLPFPKSVRCRIVWMELSLANKSDSSSKMKEDFNLLAFDENPFTVAGPHDSSVCPDKNEACIHAKRILLFGSSVKRDTQDALLHSSELQKKSYETSQQWGRFRVPIESERLMFNDLILELYLSPTAPGIAGFRLDAFSAIRPRISHSPFSLDVDIWDSSLTGLEDRHISPAILYLQVSAVQEPRNFVSIGEYRLPEVKGGVPLYFDFPVPIQAYRITFRLLGDVAAFRDDLPDQDDLTQKGIPLASGLSLSNRIKLYYYADPYELGKLASLSAV